MNYYSKCCPIIIRRQLPQCQPADKGIINALIQAYGFQRDLSTTLSSLSVFYLFIFFWNLTTGVITLYLIIMLTHVLFLYDYFSSQLYGSLQFFFKIKA